MVLKEGLLVMTSRGVLLACFVGVSIAIGLLSPLYIPEFPWNRATMDQYTFTFTKTGISVEKLILLNYFVFMPWPVSNLMHVTHFNAVDYDDPIEEDGIVFTLIHSLFFLLGALIAEALSGTGVPRLGEEAFWKQEKNVLPPWILYTILTLVAHLPLMGAATTYYTGPGGPVWFYPSPLWLIPFGVGILVISYLTEIIYIGARKVVGSG